MSGFYSPTVWTKQRRPLTLVPQCGACGLFQHVHSPYMKPTGSGRRKVLLVGEAPGQQEDQQDKQFIGPAGLELSRLLGKIDVSLRRDCWLTNAVICRPLTPEGGNRKPTPNEIDYCRPNLLKTLRELQPDVVIPLGEVACRSLIDYAWKEGEVDNISDWCGWRIPSRKLNCWICPTYHPSYLLRQQSDSPQTAGVLELHMTRHLRQAFTLTGKPYQDIPDYDAWITVEMDPYKVVKSLRVLAASKVPLAIDLETTGLKPDGPKAEILCCAVSDGKVSLAFPWLGRTAEAVRELIASDVPLIAANIRFEERWFRKFLGRGARNWLWDTVLGAHWRRCHPGICSLKFQAFVLLGMPDYDSHLKPYMQSNNCNTPNRLREIEPRVLMHYNATDSLLEVLVAQIQMKGLSA